MATLYSKVILARHRNLDMIFLNYVLLVVFATCVVLVAASIWAFRFVRTRRPLSRISVRCLAALVVACCIFTAGLSTISALTTITSSPIYSPDGKHALRVDYADAGALGGVTFVMLYANHGFQSNVIFSQEGRTVRAENLRWVSDSEILVPYSIYSPYYRPQVCAGPARIKVHCVEIAPATLQ
jgi:hypothetical protein